MQTDDTLTLDDLSSREMEFARELDLEMELARELDRDDRPMEEV